MRYILDTDVLSETRRRNGNDAVRSFVRSLSAEQIYLSVITLGEVRRGALAKRRSDPAFSDHLLAWLGEVEATMDGRVLPVTTAIAHRWGEMSSDRTRPVTDTLIAATASVHDLTVVTRNERDYRDLGVRVVNPWR